MCTALWQRKWAQRCDSENEHSAVTAMVRILMLQRWQWQHWDVSGYDTDVTAMFTDGSWHYCDSGDNRQWCVSGGSWHRCVSDVYISVTAMTADSAVTAVTTDSTVTAVAADSAVTAMCTLMWQRCQLPLLSQWCAHRSHTNVNIAVTALSVVIAVTLVCTVVLQRCHCHRCCTVVSLHRWHTNVDAIAVTVLSLPLMLH